MVAAPDIRVSSQRKQLHPQPPEMPISTRPAGRPVKAEDHPGCKDGRAVGRELTAGDEGKWGQWKDFCSILAWKL